MKEKTLTIKWKISKKKLYVGWDFGQKTLGSEIYNVMMYVMHGLVNDEIKINKEKAGIRPTANMRRHCP